MGAALSARTRSSKTPETFRAGKAIFSLSASINGEVHAPGTPCTKGTSVHIKNLWIKHLCNRKVRDFAMAFRASRKVPGLLNGPQFSCAQKRRSVYARNVLYEGIFPLRFCYGFPGAKTFRDLRETGSCRTRFWLRKLTYSIFCLRHFRIRLMCQAIILNQLKLSRWYWYICCCAR